MQEEQSSHMIRISCYHCYKLVFDEQSYFDRVLNKKFCSEDCSIEFASVTKVPCSRNGCYRSFFKRDAIQVLNFLFCSEECHKIGVSPDVEHGIIGTGTSVST